MPRRAVRKARKARRAPRRNRKSRVPRSLNPMNQSATIVETIDVTGFIAQQVYPSAINLAQFPRSTLVAANFKWYKCVSIEYKYTPRYNTFQEQGTGSTNNSSVPYVYTIMNRTQDSLAPAVTPLMGRQFMESMGAKPRTFTKAFTLRYKPNWCSPGLISLQSTSFLTGNTSNPNQNAYTNLVQNGLKAEYGWINCPNFVAPQTGLSAINAFEAPINGPPGMVSGPASSIYPVYNGHYFYVQQRQQGGVDPDVCDLQITAKWVFKHPGGFATDAPRDPPPVEALNITGVTKE